MKFATKACKRVLILFVHLIIPVSAMQGMQAVLDTAAMQYTVNFMWVGKRLAVSPVFLHSSKRSAVEQSVHVKNIFTVLREWASIKGPLSINLWYDGALLEDGSDLTALSGMVAQHQAQLPVKIRLLDVRFLPLIHEDAIGVCAALSKLFTPIAQDDPLVQCSLKQQLRFARRKSEQGIQSEQLVRDIIKDMSKNRRYFGVDLIRAIMTHAAAQGDLGGEFGDCFIYSDLDIAQPLPCTELFDAETACHLTRCPIVMMRHGEQDCGLQGPLLGDMNFYENGFQIIRTRNAVCAKLILEQIILPAVRDVSDPEVFSNIWGGGIWHRYGALLSSLLPKPLGDLQRRESSDWKLLVPTKYMPFIEPSDYHINPDK